MTKTPLLLVHRIYRRLRPILYQMGLLKLARTLFSADMRRKVAQKIGLTGFDMTKAIDPSHYNYLQVSREPQSFKCEGINLVGDLRVDIGLGEATRLIVDAAHHCNMPIAYAEFAAPLALRTQPLTPHLLQNLDYDVTLIHLNPSEMLPVLEALPRHLLQSYRIAFWYWELPIFPAQWQHVFDYVHEIWVASHFTQATIASVAPVPVARIPLPIQVQAQSVSRADYHLPDNRFIFLYSFSPTSTIGRKNPFAVIEAYRRAFANSSDAPLLVIKTHHLDTPYGQQVATPLRQQIASVGGLLIEDNLSRQAMWNLLSLSDCYVSLHRSEGFGLGMAESMALGKPVIATGYSGNMDFMTTHNSYLVRYALREITPEDHQYFPAMSQVYEVGQLWAEPDIDHASQLMRHVVEHPAEAYRMGQQAQSDMQTGYSLAATGHAMQQRLHQLRNL